MLTNFKLIEPLLETLREDEENWIYVKVALNRITHVGSHFVAEEIIVVEDMFWRLRVQKRLKPRINVILPDLHTSGMKIIVRFDKLLTFSGENAGFH